jgi:hypothetical protein
MPTTTITDGTIAIITTTIGTETDDREMAPHGAIFFARRISSNLPCMDPLHANIEEFAAEGYTHVSCHCPRCRMTRMQPMSWLPKITRGLTLDRLARRLRCAECGGPLQSIKPWRQEDTLGKPQGRRG